MIMNTVDEWTTKIRLKDKFGLTCIQLTSDINGDNPPKRSETIPRVPRSRSV